MHHGVMVAQHRLGVVRLLWLVLLRFSPFGGTSAACLMLGPTRCPQDRTILPSHPPQPDPARSGGAVGWPAQCQTVDHVP
ncbi:hypothetical protein CBM2587_U10007 [Cupriavidus taiwanensis]|uniref:Uncharacterized protein n=1 Tax=Cupriavidus taiwanensis TaxID=164546 RepID=A0A375CKB3_9BURK|nr:hypothetical protein CBM2587_U10007 [Cupriavidus taiwanensis]